MKTFQIHSLKLQFESTASARSIPLTAHNLVEAINRDIRHHAERPRLSLPDDPETCTRIIAGDVQPEPTPPTDRLVRCIVAGFNANGEPDLFFCKVNSTTDQLVQGDHYEIAEITARLTGYQGPFVCFDEKDSAGFSLLPLFKWETASIITVPRLFQDVDGYYWLQDGELMSAPVFANGSLDRDNAGDVDLEQTQGRFLRRLTQIRADLRAESGQNAC